MGYVTSYEHSGFGDDPDHDADIEFMKSFYRCGRVTTVRVLRDQLPRRRFALSVLLVCLPYIRSMRKSIDSCCRKYNFYFNTALRQSVAQPN